MTGRVRHLIGRALPAGPVPTPEELAGRLSVSPQTLRRQPAAEGATYQRIRDQVRRDHAIAELTGGRRPACLPAVTEGGMGCRPNSGRWNPVPARRDDRATSLIAIGLEKRAGSAGRRLTLTRERGRTLPP
ncbi:helix-turn-helix transcriptional regulator [Streptomyces hydrogenans]|uniref:hypothetical protein n=1 Tax=Streptomyces hydrogenans TaxID=1873719 RepID=UPI0037F93B66